MVVASASVIKEQIPPDGCNHHFCPQGCPGLPSSLLGGLQDEQIGLMQAQALQPLKGSSS